jgi:hypothetical protein
MTLGMKMRSHAIGVLSAALLLSAVVALPAQAACKQKRRDPSFVELAVPDDAIRPKGVEDFAFVTDDVTYDQLIARAGPPDASQGTSRLSRFIWCFADGTELTLATRDRVSIEYIRHDGKLIYKRGKK